MTFDAFRRDLRFAVRSLSRSPGFVTVAVVTLGLGLALASTTFTVIDSLRSPYLPIEDPDRVFEVSRVGGGRGWVDPSDVVHGVISRFAEDTASYRMVRAVVATGDSVDDDFVTAVSPTLFSLLGITPIRGRLFRPETGSEDGVAVVSYRFWVGPLAGRPLDGATVLVNQRVYTVIGVLPPGMTFDISVPMTDGLAQRWWGRTVVRLRAGVSPDEVNQALTLAAARLNTDLGEDQYPYGFRLDPIVGDPLDLKKMDFAMAGAGLVILLIACANLSNLMLARGAGRRRAIALRFAVGAHRGALVREQLAEGVVLAVAGGLLGLVLTAWCVDLLVHKVPQYGVLTLHPPRLSWRVFGFGLLAAGGALVLFGLLPALRTTDVDLTEPLKADSGTITSRVRRYSLIVVAEVAMALVLLTGGALLTRAVVRAAAFEFGYDSHRLYATWLSINSPRASADSVSRLVAAVVDRVSRVPGVASASTIHWQWPENYMILSDAYNRQAGFLATGAAAMVRPNFLRTLGIPILYGRDFLDGEDVIGAAVVDEAAARELFGAASQDVIGRSIKLGDEASLAPWIRVVGVARGARFMRRPSDYNPFIQLPPTVYVVSDQSPARRAQLVMRLSAQNPAAAELEVRRVLRESLGRAPWPPSLVAYNERFERELRGRRFVVGVFALFSSLALALAAIGVYGVLAHAVSRRMREFAVRVALGAGRRRVLTLVLHDGAVMLLAGTGLGAFAAMWAGQLLDAWLYDVFFVDVISLVIAEAVLLAAGLAACVAPALKATRADPVEILRAT